MKGIWTVILAAAGLLGGSLAMAMPAPPGSDIWITPMNGEFELRNLTARPGYDNQPAFEGESSMLFTRLAGNGQTEIARMDLDSGDVSIVIQTPESEYSPTPMPGGGISSVRVSLDGVQQLWQLEPGAERFELLLPGITGVGYHLWLDNRRLALFIVADPPELHVASLDSDKVMVLARDIGRSLQNVPGSENSLAFIEPGENGKRWIKKLDLGSRKLARIAPALEDSQDFAFHPDGRLFMASGKRLSAWQGDQWQESGHFPELPGNISRLAFSPSGNSLAMVVSETTQ